MKAARSVGILGAAGLLFVAAACGDSQETGDGGIPSTVTIGVLDDLTGPAAFCGTDELKGIEVAVAEAQESNYLGEGVTIKLVTEDSASNPERAVAGYQALLRSDAAGILGPCVSSAAGAIVQRAERDGIAIVLTTSGSVPLADPEWVYRAGVISLEYAPKMVDELKARGIESTAMIISTENPVHTTLAEEVFKPGFAAAGIEVGPVEEITPDTQDLSTQITNIKQANPDAIGVIATGDSNRTILEQLREAGLDQLVWGQQGMHNDAFVRNGGPVTDGVIFITSFAPCFGEAAGSFAERYEAATGAVPGFAAAHGYDAAKRLLAAIKAANSVDREAVNEALKSAVTSLDGAQGRLTFDEVGNSKGAGGVVEIRSGELICP